MSIATALSQWKGRWLDLNGLQQIDEVMAKALAQFKAEIVALKTILEQINPYK